MTQSRAMSAAEAVTNVAIGYMVALGAQFVVFPWFGMFPSMRVNLTIALVFTVVSVVRSYVVRRSFEALRGRG